MKNLFLIIFILFLFSCKNAKEPSPKVEQIPADTIQTQKKELPKPKPKPFVPDYDTAQWIELVSLDSSIILDLKYATTDNFVDEQLYDCGRCFLRHEAARQLIKVQRSLKDKGLSV